MLAEVFTISGGVAVWVSCQIDIGHGIRSDQVKEVVDSIKTPSTTRFLLLVIFTPDAIEDKIWHSEPAIHERTGHYASEMVGY